MSIWDDPDLQLGGEFVTFEDIGDSVSGTITAVRTQRFDDGKVAPQLLLTTDDGEDRTLTAGQVRLKAQLAEQRPEAGDHLRVVLSNIERRGGGKTLKHFDVVVTRGAVKPVAAGNQGWQSPQAAAPPFAQAAPVQPPVQQPVPVPVQQPVQQAAPVDTAAALAALANLTHEQKVALGIA